jgi:hypothetical protein
MMLFLTSEVLSALGILAAIETQCTFVAHAAQQAGTSCPHLPEETHKQIVETVGKLFSYFSLGTVTEKLQLSLYQLENNRRMDASAIGTELRNIREAISTESYRHCFLRVVPERSTFINQSALLGDEVAQAFPSAIPDIREAGNCLAAECNTAAVFHLMRVVEWGLRALCVDLGFRRVKSKFKKSGKLHYSPIAYSEWEKLLDELQDRADAKISRLRRGVNKQNTQQFYYPALQDIRGIRDAWRNHTMHTRDEYNHEDADAILTHVKRLMGTLATRVAEV